MKDKPFNPLSSIGFDQSEDGGTDLFYLDLNTDEGAEMLVIFIEALSKIEKYAFLVSYLTDIIPQRQAVGKIKRAIEPHKQMLQEALADFQQQNILFALANNATQGDDDDDTEGH